MPTVPKPTRQLASKLQLTAAALGCATGKELCGRFAAVNPATAFTLENAYKWMRGKAQPRMSSVYEDWAAVLGVGLTPQFVAAASFEAFAEALAPHFFLAEETVAALAAAAVEDDGAARAPATDSTWSAEHILVGRFLAISPAWSPARRGSLIAGPVDIAARPDGWLATSYREHLFGQTVEMAGRLAVDGRTAQGSLTCSSTGRLFYFALLVPPPPGSLVGGLFCGNALHDPDARPTAGRIAFVRDRALGPEALEARARYIDADAAILAAELAALGYAGGEAAAKQLLAFLVAPIGGMTIAADAGEAGSIGMALDRLIAG
jgi:hypothetical protein